MPRSIVQHLEQEIAALEKEIEDQNNSIASTSFNVASFDPLEGRQERRHGLENTLHLGEGSINLDNQLMILTDFGPIARFHGSSSVFSLTVEILTTAAMKSLYQSTPATITSVSSAHQARGSFGAFRSTLLTEMSEAMVQSLISLFLTSTNMIYPIVDEDELQGDLHTYLELQRQSNLDVTRLSGQEAYQFFRISMICGIACANRSRREQSFLPYSHSFFDQAAMCVEEVTSAVSSQSLEALLLLILYCLFYPRKGNIWKLLDFACRLSIELGFHTEQDFAHESPRRQIMRRHTFWSLYTIEHMMGQFLGRPSDLPDAIISTSLPVTLP